MKVSLSIFALLGAVVVLVLSVHGAQPPLPPRPVPIPPMPPSPIQEFRNWLQMSEADRELALQGYPAEKQTVLRRKIQAYAAMPADQRERRLKMLELRWYMRPLMGVLPEERGNYQELMPPRLRELVASRLAQWDRLDAATRTEILANDEAREMATRYFIHLRRSTSQAMPELQSIDAAKRAELQEKLRHWQQTTPAQRGRMAEQLSAFFELAAPEQQRTLEDFSEQDRQEMQKALEVFAKLPSQNRQICVKSFQKFATMTPQERGEFLRKAERWQQMTPQERQTWKSLITKLPPMPPEPIEMPPKPQAHFMQGEKVAAF
jgi:hypothetical protein